MAETREKGISIKLKVEAQNVKTTISGIKTDIKTLEAEYKHLNQASKIEPYNLENYRRELNNLGDSLVKQRQLVSALTQKIDIGNQELAQAGEYVKYCEERYKKLGEQLEYTKKYHGEDADAVKASEKLYKSAEGTLNAAKKQYADLTKEIDSATRQRTVEVAKLETLEIHYNNLEDSMYEMADANKQALKVVDMNIDSLKNQVKAAEKDQKAIEKLNSTKPDGIRDFNAEIESLTKLIDQNQKLQEQLARKCELVTKEYGENSAEAKKATAEYESQKVVITGLNAKLDDLRKYSSQSAIQEREHARALEELDGRLQSSGDKIDAFTIALGNLAARGIEEAIRGIKRLGEQVIETGNSFESGMVGLASILQVSNNDPAITMLAGQFRELAKNSKFSADEMANNAKVLANAGYEADQISSSIEAISNLAAATSEEFETMANVVVDGLAEFGMGANEAEHFADVLAKTAISSNTNVTQLGEAFKYAGSVAGQFGYSIEDVGAALGTMAANGIKGSAAGTALRTILSRLAANTSDARTQVEALGVQFYNSDGSARKLSDVLGDLRKALGGLTDQQKAEVEVSIAGQRGLSALAAIINASEEDWNNLSGEIKDYNTTVSEMSQTRLDSYAGDLAKLKNNWADVSIEMFQNVEPSLRKVLTALKNVTQSEAFRKDVAKLAKSAANAIDSLAKVITKFGDNSVSTATNVASLFATFAGTTSAVKGIANVTKGAKEMYDVFKLAQGANLSFIEAFTRFPSVFGLAAAAFLTLGVAAKQSQDQWLENINATYGLTESHAKLIESINSAKESYDELKNSTAENITQVESEYAHYEELARTYDSLLDENGKVIKGNEEQAEQIKTVLAGALGLEIDQLNSMIESHHSLTAAIEETITKKKAQILLNAFEEQYAEALRNTTTATQNLLEAESAMEEQKARTAAAEQAYNEALNLQALDLQNYGYVTSETQEILNNATVAWGQATGALETASEAVSTARSTVDDYNTVIKNYEGVSSAIVKGDADKISTSLNLLTNNFATAETASRETLEKQTKTLQENYEKMKRAADEGSSTVTKEAVDNARQMWIDSKMELNKLPPVVEETMDKYGEKVKAGGTVAHGHAKVAAVKTKEGLLSQDYASAGNAVVSGFGGAIERGSDSIWAKAWNLGKSALAALKRSIDSNSPSKETFKIGEYFDDGLIGGIERKESQIVATASRIGKKSLEALKQEGQLYTGIRASSDNRNMQANVYMTVNAAEGQNVEELSEMVANRINRQIQREELVWR